MTFFSSRFHCAGQRHSPATNGAIPIHFRLHEKEFNLNNSNIGSSAEQIASWLKVLVEPGSIVEMRVVFEKGPPNVRHYSSEELPTLASDAIRLSKEAKSVLFQLNPLSDDSCGSPATDVNITKRKWLQIDCNPNFNKTITSTDEERDASREVMCKVDAFLCNCGWPCPVIVDAGNSWRLLYRIELANEDDGLVNRVLEALAALFDEGIVLIDTDIGTPLQTCPVFGVVQALGQNLPHRPHRVPVILTIPETVEIVPVEKLKTLAGETEPTDAMCAETVNNPAKQTRESRPEAVEKASEYLMTLNPSITGSNGREKLLASTRSVLLNDYMLTDDEATELLNSVLNPRIQLRSNKNENRRSDTNSKKGNPGRPSPDSSSKSTAEVSDADRPSIRQVQKNLTEAITVRLSDVEEQKVDWLWPNRFPLGKLSLFAGDPGLGKSFVTVDMAARISTGTGWPDCFDRGQPVGSVILFNCEDDIADTVLPRLIRAGGDPKKVIALQGVATTDSETGDRRQRGFSLDVDLPKLIEVLEANPDVRLVVIDPVSAYCGATDSHKNAEIRAMLAPLAELAGKYRVAVVMVTHLSKGNGGKAVYRAMGSLAFAAAARAVWYVCKDPDNDKRRLILMAKMNVCEESTGLAYSLVDGAVHWEENPVLMTADEHLAKESQSERTPRSGEQGAALREAGEWLVNKLSQCSVTAKFIKKLADDADISMATLKRAKKRAKVESVRIGFSCESVVWWVLPPLNHEFDDEVKFDADEDVEFP